MSTIVDRQNLDFLLFDMFDLEKVHAFGPFEGQDRELISQLLMRSVAQLLHFRKCSMINQLMLCTFQRRTKNIMIRQWLRFPLVSTSCVKSP